MQRQASLSEITRTERIELPRKDFYDAIANYEAYPEFVPHIVHAKIVEVDGNRSRVQFKAHYIRDIPYTLDIYHDDPRRIWWELVESPIFKVSSGSWNLRYKGKSKTEVDYCVEVVPRILVPSRIIETLTRKGLPTMIQAFVSRAERRG